MLILLGVTLKRNHKQSDLEIVNKTLQGDTSAFKTIIERYQDYLYRTALAFLGNPEEAEDALQEIFINVYRYLGTFRLGMEFRPWIYTTALNHLKKIYRKKKKNLKFSARDNEMLESLPDNSRGSDPQIMAEKKETEAAVLRAVHLLQDDLRVVVTLYYLNEMSTREISEILNLGIENIKSRLYRARKILKKILGKNKTGL